MDLQAFEEAHATISEEERKKGEEPKRITRPKRSKQQNNEKKKTIDEKYKEMEYDLNALGTPSASPLKITSEECVHPKRRRFNRIRKSQKTKIPIPATPLTITSKVEEVKDSPSLELPKETKCKENQENKMVKEEKQLEETYKTNTLVQKLLFAILLEL
jgi:hypothetical protein